jgi:SAM-dependent methyltransferase
VRLLAGRLGRPDRVVSAVGNPSVLEVGSGTGVFTAALADAWFGRRLVVGVEPSRGMLDEARRLHPHPHVAYLQGQASALPLRDAVADLALLSRVIHHLPDRLSAAHELAGVTRPGARMVIRTTVRERLDSLVYRYWPELLESDRRRFPSTDEITTDFQRAGLASVTVTSFSQPVAEDLVSYRQRLSSRPQSKFTYLTDEQFRDGLRRLDADIPTSVGPVEERYDVLVFER